MENMEIERKFLVQKLPENLQSYPFHQIEQGYLSTGPVVRIRRQDEDYILTYKSGGMMARMEYNLPLTKESYEHLKQKCDGIFIQKKRYCIPYENYTIELDIFQGDIAPLILAEVEFESQQEAMLFQGPSWFGEDVTTDGRYHNSYLSKFGYKGNECPMT